MSPTQQPRPGIFRTLIKTTRYLVISQNTIAGPHAREQGWGMSIHIGESAIPTRDASILGNTLFQLPSGVVLTSSNGTKDVDVFGNVIYNIRNYYSEPRSRDVDYANGISGFANTAGVYRIADNTIDDYETGIRVSGIPSDSAVKIHGNILSNRASATGYEISVPSGSEPYAGIDYNLVPSAARYFWDNGTRNLAYMQGDGMEAHAVADDDPEYTDAATRDYSLLTTSPAKGASVEGPVGDTVYDRFFTLWGISGQYDLTGGGRPVDAWDMGAIEFGSVYTPPVEPDPPPSGGSITTGTLNVGALNIGG